MVPGGIGVQEGALVAVGAAFGVASLAALALGIVKRGRELLVGAPAIVAWWIAERHSIATFWSRRTRRRDAGWNAPSPRRNAGMRRAPRLRVGALVDLYWSPTAGGHVKTWERLAAAAAVTGEGIDLTVHFLGVGARPMCSDPMSVTRFIRRCSQRRLPFLSHIPDHTDLAPHNPLLTRGCAAMT